MQAKTIFYIYIYNVEAYTKNEYSTNRLPGMDWTLLSDIMLKKTWNHELPVLACILLPPNTGLDSKDSG
jgi:hypothetical protein